MPHLYINDHFVYPPNKALATRLGVNRYFTGNPCKHGHLAPRATSNGACLVCRSNSVELWRVRHPEKAKAGYTREYHRYYATEGGRTYHQNKSKQNAEEMTDNYIRGLLVKDYGMNPSEITLEIISMRREQLALGRLAKALKRGADEAIRNDT